MRKRARRMLCAASIGVVRKGLQDVALIEDISTGGIRIKGVMGVRVGEVLRLHAKGHAFSVQVRWARGTSCGTQFLKEAAPETIGRALAALRGTRRVQVELFPLRCHMQV